ncbi:hypothetical protein QIS99_25955 [Streptomyces sp. B-S-A8]|uniref:AAA+ ATPase domain-containing protein n=1 Tax=Streptomyces solicavernae TaxID=3043614 RepID=A0ABT6RYV5_9ACTN|nr:hypothetical protein [Streptomyces sp. B-S-A8]MDI3389605.1 hypothetical protein [Streptomyces sp. B-S-A8]
MRVELPPEPVYFVNRDEEKARALRAVTEWQGRARPLILALRGPAGLGKTELAGVLARSQLERFPHGVLSVDLDDFRLRGVADPGEVLEQLLRSLGVESALVEAQFRARSKQYWSLTRDLRFILVVDNVRYASELEPLLPASGGCVVIAAGHGPLRELEGGAVDLPLPPLGERAATELMESIVRSSRPTAGQEDVRALVRLCEGLPMALHVTGKWVRASPLRPLPRLVEELRGEFDERGVDGVEHLWNTVYEDLSPPAALLYRLLPHHPAATFTVPSATALLGLGEDSCTQALEELDRVGFLDLQRAVTEGLPLRLPGPLRAHALRRSRRDATEREVTEARTRILRWFVRQAQLADRYAAGERLTVADRYEEVPGAPDVPLDDPRAAHGAEREARVARAARWLYEERHALFACVRTAHAYGRDAEAVALSEPLWTYALDHPYQPEVVEVFRHAVEGAVRDGRHAAWIARTRCQLARPLWESGRFEEAERELSAAAAALRLLGDGTEDRRLTASVTEFQGMLSGARGAWAEAAAYFVRSRDIHRTLTGSDYGVMLQTYRLGEARWKLGETEAAHELLSDAHARAVKLERQRMTGRTAFALAGVERELRGAAACTDEEPEAGVRRLGRARELYEQALASARGRRSGFDQARIQDALAALAEEDGRGADAAEHREAAHAIRRRNGLVD